MTDFDSLFTATSLFTLQGSVAATLLVPNALGKLFGDDFAPVRKWVAFAVAMVLSIAAAALAEGEAVKWLVGLFNGFMVFTSAMGINETAPRVAGKQKTVAMPAATGDQFFASWLRPLDSGSVA